MQWQKQHLLSVFTSLQDLQHCGGIHWRLTDVRKNIKQYPHFRWEFYQQYAPWWIQDKLQSAFSCVFFTKGVSMRVEMRWNYYYFSNDTVRKVSRGQELECLTRSRLLVLWLDRKRRWRLRLSLTPLVLVLQFNLVYSDTTAHLHAPKSWFWNVIR